MRIRWWHKDDNGEANDAEGLTDLMPKRESAFASRMQRIRNGQDVEFEQLTVHLRNKHF